jgi:hypothetical protein
MDGVITCRKCPNFGVYPTWTFDSRRRPLMDIATLRDFIIVIYGSLGIVLCIMLGVFAFMLFLKVWSIMKDVMSIMEKLKIISDYVSKEIVEPLIDLSVAIHSATEGINQLRHFLTGKGRKTNDGKRIDT